MSEWAGEVDRGRMVWELLARPRIEYAAEVWWKEDIVHTGN